MKSLRTINSRTRASPCVSDGCKWEKKLECVQPLTHTLPALLLGMDRRRTSPFYYYHLLPCTCFLLRRATHERPLDYKPPSLSLSPVLPCGLRALASPFFPFPARPPVAPRRCVRGVVHTKWPIYPHGTFRQNNARASVAVYLLSRSAILNSRISATSTVSWKSNRPSRCFKSIVGS